MNLRMLRLDLLRAVKSPNFLIAILASPIASSSIFGHHLAHRTVYGLPANEYFLVSMATSGALCAAFTATSQWISRERAAGWTLHVRMLPGRIGWYLAGKFALGAIAALVSVVCVLAWGGRSQHLALAGATMLRISAAVLCGALAFCVLGAAAGYLCDPKALLLPLALFTWGFSLLSGLFYPELTLPPSMRFLAEVTPTGRVGDLAHRALTGAAPSASDVAVLVGYAALAALVLAWAQRRDHRTVRA